MAWLNLNQSLNSLKGQITNFASEVLSEGVVQESAEDTSTHSPLSEDLEAKCREQALEIAALKKLNEELKTSLQAERISKHNGIRDDDSNWYWDPPPNIAPPTKHSNEAVEQQYKEQIQMLQQELSNVKLQDGLDMRSNTEEEINRLREENKNLTENLEALDSQHQTAMEKLLTLKYELQSNFELLKQEHDELKKANNEYTSEIKNLVNKLAEKDKEIEHLTSVKSEHSTLQHKYQNLERIYGLLKENAEKFQEENQDLNEEVFKLQEHITKLEHDLEVATKNTGSVSNNAFEELKKELQFLKDKNNTNQLHSYEVNIDDNAKSVIEKLKRDIADLNHQLNKKDSGNQDHDDHKSIKIEKILQLFNKYVNFDLPVDYVGEIPTGDDVALFKLESTFKSVNTFKKEIDALQQRISEKDLKILHLKTQIDDLTSENDFVNTDIQHLERELNEMKKNNDFLINEIAALKNSSKLEPIIETHEDNLDKLETELANSNKLNVTFKSQIEQINKELGEVRKEKEFLQEALNHMKSKYTSMLSELDICKNKTDEIEQFETSTNKENIEQLTQATEERDELRKRLTSISSKNEQLSIDLHIVENDKVLLMKEVDELKQKWNEKKLSYDELTAHTENLNIKINDLERALKEKHKKENVKKMTCSDSDGMVISGNIENIIIENVKLKEIVEQLTSEHTALNNQYKKLQSEINELNDNHQESERNNTNLTKTINELKARAVQYDVLVQEFTSLKTEHHSLNEKNEKLLYELMTNEKKFAELESKYEKVQIELNEKKTLTESLKDTIEKRNETIQNLEHNLTISEKELQNLTKEYEELSKTINLTQTQSHRNLDEIKQLQSEKQDLTQQSLELIEQVKNKNIELQELNDRLELTVNKSLEYKNLIAAKDKNIQELNESILELTDKLKSKENITELSDECNKLSQEKSSEKQIEELNITINIKENEIKELTSKYNQSESTCAEYKNAIEKSSSEKAELINLINLKHNESLQYHNEIQRLNHVLVEQRNEFIKSLEDKDKLIENTATKCANCENMLMTLKENDEIILNLNQSVGDYDGLKQEFNASNETIKNLTEKCNNLDKTLTVQLDTVKKLTAENVKLSEQEQNLTRELDRLRQHLMETEENYTQELMTSEQKLTECQTRLHQVEDRAKQTSTLYTSNSIRANQEVETLRNQIKLLEKQREEDQGKLSQADDARSRAEAALTNLQVVLEQFQMEKERDIASATEKQRKKIEELKINNSGLQNEITRLNSKLEDSLAGLQAASRLGDQVETKTAQINDLKEQVKTLQMTVTAAEERYYNSISNQQDKVDKNLVKNLLMNYVLTGGSNSTDKTQVLRVLSTVLDFNQQECERLGLARSANSADSLAMEFVKFLQAESKPRPQLPSMMRLANKTPSRRPSDAGSISRLTGSSPTPSLDSGSTRSHNRNPSTGSNNLLFQNLDTSDTDQNPNVTVGPLDTGINQTRNNEGAILKHVLKDI